jgi:hypothetical protein
MTTTLAISLIVRNEEQALGRCLGGKGDAALFESE